MHPSKSLDKTSPTATRQAAMRLLARRDHSQLELQRKLIQRGYDTAAVKTICQELIQQGLLNDARFTESYCYWRKNRGYGPLRIAMELQQHGVTSDLIEHYLQPDAPEWLDHMQRVYQKRFGKKNLKDLHEKAGCMRFLQYRGFSGAQIQILLKSKS